MWLKTLKFEVIISKSLIILLHNNGYVHIVTRNLGHEIIEKRMYRVSIYRHVHMGIWVAALFISTTSYNQNMYNTLMSEAKRVNSWTPILNLLNQIFDLICVYTIQGFPKNMSIFS